MHRALIVGAFSLLTVAIGNAQSANHANWKLAEKFSSAALRPYIYSSRVSPNFLKDADQFWYVWREASGKRFMYVDPAKKLRETLFDHVKLAAQLSELHKRPYEANGLPFDRVEMKEAGKFQFQLEGKWYDYDRAKDLLTVGKAPETPKVEATEHRTKSPDKKAYVFAQDLNLYVVEGTDDDYGLKISNDAVEDYTFSSFGFFGGRSIVEGSLNQPQRKTRPQATWSEDSKAFFVNRYDFRKVKDLFLVNNLAEPRPSLLRYKYAMPGEEYIPQQELWVYSRVTRGFKRVKAEKWKDQLLFDIHFAGNGSEKLRFVRRERTQRNLELCEYDLTTDEIKVLLTESVENAFLEIQPVKYIDKEKKGDFIWFSERTGWGHYYLYSNDGKLKKALTSGPWRAEGIAEVDAEKGFAWFEGVGRNPNENPYNTHLYRVKLDGEDFRDLTPYDADHDTGLSFSKKYTVSTASRMDLVPSSAVYDDTGKRIIELETMDLTRLKEMGWQMPEAFKVKSDDGVWDIYGNMWKPFDFDPKKKYPIILNIYPGPQTESVSSTFSPISTTQQLAQLGFIVIQIGNRGGTPQRSNAYHSYGYYNLRDYGMADKKAGVEQLASRYPWIDIDRVGIFGHSGGGFMTAAALLLPPYNEFFKVGVSSAGNHDNNIYNSNWSEQHHGLRVVSSVFDTGSSTTKAAGTKPEGGPLSGEEWAEQVGTNPLDAILFVEAQEKKEEEKKTKVEERKEATKFEIKVPTTTELAKNLVGKLLIVHGDMDNNVHPANSTRLVNALIKENKRFDYMTMPGQAHGFGTMQPYFTQMLMEYFAEFLMGDGYRKSADMKQKGGR
jgi:dipeptidyl-peptidase 4